MNSIDASLQLQKMLWLGIIAILAVFSGVLLAKDSYFLLLVIGLCFWVVLLPYHARLAVGVSVATFTSALIMPLPGRPYWWEIGALMGWTGILLVVALRRYSPSTGWTIRRNFWFFFGVVAYCTVLVVIMNYRGIGFRVFGGAQVGGRLYFQQLICAVFPLLFAMLPPSEKIMVRLFSLQCLLALTYLISDFVFSFGGSAMYGILLFFELPGDGYNFESQSAQFGIRRFQSLYLVAEALIMLLLVRWRLADFTSWRTIWLWFVGIALIGVGLLGGHRYLLILLGFMSIVLIYTQRFLNGQRLVVSGALFLISYLMLFLFSDKLPVAAQRAVSMLPGIEVSRLAREDGDVTWQGRKDLRRLGWQLAPQYYLLGRGFRKNEYMAGGIYDPYAVFRDPDTFFNGFVGLLVNTGIPGTTAMMIVLASGTVLSLRIIRAVRILGTGDNFLRFSSVVSAHWIASTVIFIFLHGDSEFALRGFALPGAILMVCDLHLRERLFAAGLIAGPAKLILFGPREKPTEAIPGLPELAVPRLEG